MQNRMLNAADILVNRHPVFYFFLIQRAGKVIRTAVAEEIPGGFDKGVHGIGFASGSFAAERAADIYKRVNLCQRTAAITGKGDVKRQDNRQILFRNRNSAARVTVDHRYRITPVTLAGDAPIAKAIVDCLFTATVFLQPISNQLFGCKTADPVELT